MLIHLRTYDNHPMDPNVSQDEKNDLGTSIYTNDCNNIREAFELAINEQINLSNLYLYNEDLSNLTISNVNLSKSSLGKCDFTNSKFINVDLSGADLSNNNFTNVTFTDVDFSVANLSDSNFTDCIFENCILNDINIVGVIGNGKEIVTKKYGPYLVTSNYKDAAVGCYQRDIRIWLNLLDDDFDSIFQTKFQKDIWLKYRTDVINDLKLYIQDV